MNYGQLPGLDKPVSRVVQGTTVLKPDNPCTELFDHVFAQGCNTFDTGRIYGNHNEGHTAKWIHSRGVRDKVVFIAKGCHHSGIRKRVNPCDIESDIRDTLAVTGFDYLDVYLLHRDDETVPVCEIIDCLNEQVELGRIRVFGGSNWTHTRIQAANRYAASTGQLGFVASSPNFCLAEQLDEPWPDCTSISGAQGAAARDWYARQEFPLFTWSSLAGGFLTGAFTSESLKENEMLQRSYGSDANWERVRRCEELGKEKGLSIAQVATAYIYNVGLNVFGLIRSTTTEEFDLNHTASTTTLSPDEVAWLNLETDAR